MGRPQYQLFGMNRAEYREINPTILDSQPHIMCEKVFKLDSGLIQYVNTEQKILNQSPCREFRVQNYTCYQNGDNLLKITDVSVEGVTLRIRDQFRIMPALQHVSQPQDSLSIFKRRNNYSDPKNSRKSDTRNLIKNLVNLYVNWLQCKRDELHEAVLQVAKETITKNKYFNKQLIQELCQDKRVCETFVQFAQEDGEDFIDNSRIQDKECHLKALQNYSRMFRECYQKLSKSPNSTSTSNE